MAGRFFWYELMTTDRNAAIDYYEAVVGWNATDQAGASPDIGYTIFSAGDRAMGGVIELSRENCDGGARPGWVGYIDVADADAKAREIVETYVQEDVKLPWYGTRMSPAGTVVHASANLYIDTLHRTFFR